MIHIFYELIQIALGKSSSLSKVPTTSEWKMLFELAQMQTLVGVLYPALEKLPIEQKPPKSILLQWFVLTERIISINKSVNIETGELSQELLKDGFKNVIMKGQGVGLLYPNPMLRMSGDIDVWVVGHRKSIIDYVQRSGIREQIVYHNITYQRFTNTPVEVHFTPSWFNCYFYNRRLQKFFKEEFNECLRHKVSLAGCSEVVSVPTKRFNAVFILQHIYRHLFGDGIGLRQLMDYYYVIQLGFTAEERIEYSKVLKYLGMYKFCGAVMYIMNTVFGMKANELPIPMDVEEGKYLLDEIMRAGNFGKYDPRIVHPENESKFHSFFRITKQVLHHVSHYPSEVFWSPIYRFWHYFWRKYNGWL